MVRATYTTHIILSHERFKNSARLEYEASRERMKYNAFEKLTFLSVTSMHTYLLVMRLSMQMLASMQTYWKTNWYSYLSGQLLSSSYKGGHNTRPWQKVHHNHNGSTQKIIKIFNHFICVNKVFSATFLTESEWWRDRKHKKYSLFFRLSECLTQNAKS